MAREKTGEHQALGDWLTAAMARTRLSAAELSRMSGGKITESSISYWKKGDTGITVDSVLHLAELLWGREPKPKVCDAETYLVQALLSDGHERAARIVTPAAAEAFLAQAEEHESIQVIRASHLPEYEKEDFVRIAQRRLDDLTRQSRQWVANQKGGSGDAA